MRKKITVFTIVFATLFKSFYAQDLDRDTLLKVGFIAPLDIPLVLAGNFGELRSNHFHTGLDFKTQRVEGKNILAVSEGHVSRISVSEYGYGLAVYIDHPSGYTTVYAHLKKLNTKLRDWLETNQYAEERVYGNFYPKNTDILVEQGEVVAFSGNSGSSTAPHLHFEIRDTKTEEPINPLLFGFNITDKVKPTVYGLKVYPIGQSKINGYNTSKRFAVTGYDGKYKLKSVSTLKIEGAFKLAVHTIDRLDAAQNKCGVNKIELYIDDELKFNHSINRINFDVSRYINAYKDYSEFKSQRHYHRTHLVKNNKLSFYDNTENDGEFDLPLGIHKVKYKIFDVYGNYSTLTFDIEITKKIDVIEDTSEYDCLVKNEIDLGGLKVVFPENTFYQDFDIKTSIRPKYVNSFSSLYNIRTKKLAPIQQEFTLLMQLDTVPQEFKQKAYIAKTAGSGKFIYVGNTKVNGLIKATTKSLGTFTVLVDTIPPVVKPINFYQDKKIASQSSLRFMFKDSQTGVSTYRAEVDGEWIPIYHNRRMGYYYYSIDRSRIKPGSKVLEIFVEDKVGNTTKKSFNLLF